MSSEDINYYRQRAAIERSRADEAPTPEIAGVHERLAELYGNFIQTMSGPVGNDHLALPPHIEQPTQPDTLQ
jgi:hypothetical protein